MIKRLLFLVGLIAFILIISILWMYSLGIIYFREIRWILIGTFVLGTIAGMIGARLKNRPKSRNINPQSERHTVDSMMEHWGTAIGIFILIVSGFQIRDRGGLSAVKLHLLGLFFTLLFGSYFLTDFIVSKKYDTLLPNMKDIIDGTIKKYILRLKMKETGKYLSSQKSSFLAFAILGGLIFISGVIKLIPFYGHIPFGILKTATSIHDVSALLFVLILAVHILLIIARRTNWPLLLSWFNGKTPPGH